MQQPYSDMNNIRPKDRSERVRKKNNINLNID